MRPLATAERYRPLPGILTLLSPCTSNMLWLIPLALLAPRAFCYVDFGTQTISYAVVPTFVVQFPNQYDNLDDKPVPGPNPQYSHITIIAPSVSVLRNGSHQTYWSIHSASVASKTISTNLKGLFRRQGVFATQLLGAPGCVPCDANGNPLTASATCTPAAYTVCNRGGINNDHTDKLGCLLWPWWTDKRNN